MGESIHSGGDYIKYFDLVFWHEGFEDEKFMTGIEKTDVINREIGLCGYFVIVTSAKMTAEDALLLYKSRDASGKHSVVINRTLGYSAKGYIQMSR